jgi:hypothetical protein
MVADIMRLILTQVVGEVVPVVMQVELEDPDHLA